MQDLVVGSVNDLTERHGFGSLASVRPVDFHLFSWKNEPEGFWAAEQDGETVGFAFSWVCGDLWFLAELFIAPAMQGRGIGHELLKRTLDQAKQAGAAHKALITFTFNRVSQALYVRHGLFPRVPIYMVGGARDAIVPRLPAGRLRHARIEHTAAHLGSLAAIDVSALGISREKHHKYLLGEAATKGFLLYAGDRDCVGYAYVNADGHTVLSPSYGLTPPRPHSPPHCIWPRKAAHPRFRLSSRGRARRRCGWQPRPGCRSSFPWC